jgi:hypothetical protein
VRNAVTASRYVWEDGAGKSSLLRHALKLTARKIVTARATPRYNDNHNGFNMFIAPWRCSTLDEGSIVLLIRILDGKRCAERFFNRVDFRIHIENVEQANPAASRMEKITKRKSFTTLFLP